MSSLYYEVNKEVCSILLKPYCSNNCIFCRPLGVSSKITPQEFSEMERDAYSAVDDFRKKRYTQIEVSGGDPLEYKKLPRLIRTLREKGFKWIRISTNGIRLSKKSFTQKLLRYGVNVFRIPLYGASASIHDSVTRIKGSFDDTVKGIRNLKSIGGTEILLTSLVLEQNKNDLINTFDFMYKLGCDNLYFAPVFVSNQDYSYFIPYIRQGHFFRKLIKHALKTHRPLRLMDVPYCVLGFDNDFTNNIQKPAHLGDKFVVPRYQAVPLLPNVPRYRLKIKLKTCKECVVTNKCAGFLWNDVSRYGIGHLKSIKKVFNS